MVGQAQPDRGRLDGDLGGGAGGEPGRGEAVQQGGVLAGDRVGLARVAGVLAQVVQGDQQALPAQPPGYGDRVGGLVPGHVAGHDAAGHRRRRDELTHPAALRGGQQNAAQHGHPLSSGWPRQRAALPAGGLRYPAGSAGHARARPGQGGHARGRPGQGAAPAT